ncbi:anti-sigma-I factor RsgI family protein [Merdimonas faecis]|uniref:anti-sigma-I factor RsgI family protein n=1 Tax=Merdimonas faecis TaxID=1653435 RepID=UPI0023F93271|nr:hypothetical protein [Merdimonas faecis]
MEKKTTYLVMETHPAYAILLDNEGRFVKAANCGYERGDRLESAVLLRYPQDARAKRRRRIRMAVSLAACICLAIFGVEQYRYVFVPYGKIQMEINPGVEMEVSRSGRVVELNGTNADGKSLIDGYEYEGKDRYEVADELADRAIEMDYLANGGEIVITADAQSAKWVQVSEREIQEELEGHLAEYDISIVISTAPEKMIQEETESITIPGPAQETQQSVQPSGEVDDGDSGYGDDSYGDNGYSGDSGYSDGDDAGDSGYDDDGDD